MAITHIDEQIIKGINQGQEEAYAILYDGYFTFLCTYATGYVFDPDEAKDLVNDVFIHVWHNRGHLSFPIHSYLVRSVQNRCLNYIRSLRTRQRVIDEYRVELLNYQEEYCMNNHNPLSMLEVEELKRQVSTAVGSLPEKCRLVFEKYLYGNLSPQEIADEAGISVNTVRVHIKNALDRIKLELGTSIGILLLFLFKK